MDYLRKYLEVIPYFNHENEKTSRFGITEDMVPSFSDGRKGIKLTTKPSMRFRYLKVEDHIIPLYPEREKPIREKIENIPLKGTFNLRDEIKKVRFKEIEDEEIEAVEYEVKKVVEEEVEQPNVRGQYLYKHLEKSPLDWHGPMGMDHREFYVQGSISADNKVKVVDTSENRSFNPIKHVTWQMTPQIITEGDNYSIVDPFPLFEGFEWYITRETIGHYLNVTVFRGNYIGRGRENPIQAKDLHFNGQKKLTSHEKGSDYSSMYSLRPEGDADFDKYITEEAILGPVLIPDYMAHQILGLICDESLSCNIILLDRPRPAFSLEGEDVKAKEEGQGKESTEKVKSVDFDKSSSKGASDKDSEDEDGSESEKDSEGDKDKDEKKAISITRVDKSRMDDQASSESGSGSDSECDSDSDSDDSDLDSKDENMDGENDDDDDDDYQEEDDYLAFKRETYRGTFESQLMDGVVKICYNTMKDEKRERRRRRRIEKKNRNSEKNSEDKSTDYRLIYHKSIELEFDRFFFTIEHKRNKSIMKMIIFETEKRSYEIRFRVDPEMGRDNLYYAMIAFQGCYKSQNYNWDDDLKSGNISPIKELIQEELEQLALKGYC
ncbi:hypothetical protein OIY81_1171 [Cryptosporidium canis]|uniref:Uncharacterized protein n=1 Tax=Cryptosporidium canis TaxID=195482 RepID=A0ABQ8P8G4_9CRYT|nr:hypothetical protein OJ252_1503 [Cryptosporidium canis]KAJ1612815.1 hypothetical protein OIY81_1171 [Cryptosporidium canis]